MVWNAMLDKTPRGGKKRGKNILATRGGIKMVIRWIDTLSEQPFGEYVFNANYHELIKNFQSVGMKFYSLS